MPKLSKKKTSTVLIWNRAIRVCFGLAEPFVSHVLFLGRIGSTEFLHHEKSDEMKSPLFLVIAKFSEPSSQKIFSSINLLSRSFLLFPSPNLVNSCTCTFFHIFSHSVCFGRPHDHFLRLPVLVEPLIPF